MRITLRRFVFAGLLTLASLAPTSSARAQIIWGGGAERGFMPSTTIPYDGEPFSHRYNYGTGAFLYPFNFSNQSGATLNYLDYADRLQRAYKFGYAPPPDPFRCPPSPSTGRARVGLGFGYGMYRAR